MHKWSSQPVIRQMTVGDYLLSASVITSSNNFQKFSLLARCMNLNMFSSSSFFRAQKHFTCN